MASALRQRKVSRPCENCGGADSPWARPAWRGRRTAGSAARGARAGGAGGGREDGRAARGPGHGGATVATGLQAGAGSSLATALQARGRGGRRWMRESRPPLGFGRYAPCARGPPPPAIVANIRHPRPPRIAPERSESKRTFLLCVDMVAFRIDVRTRRNYSYREQETQTRDTSLRVDAPAPACGVALGRFFGGKHSTAPCRSLFKAMCGGEGRHAAGSAKEGCGGQDQNRLPRRTNDTHRHGRTAWRVASRERARPASSSFHFTPPIRPPMRAIPIPVSLFVPGPARVFMDSQTARSAMSRARRSIKQ